MVTIVFEFLVHLTDDGTEYMMNVSSTFPRLGIYDFVVSEID